MQDFKIHKFKYNKNETKNIIKMKLKYARLFKVKAFSN